MRHRAAHRRLPSLLDGFLPPAEERWVRGHLGVCPRCRRRLAEFEASEALLRSIPASLIPLGAGRVGHERLRALARWAPAPRSRWTRTLPALGACTAAAVAILVMVSVGPAEPAGPTSADSSRRLVVASRGPSSYLPAAVGASATVVPYTWRQ